MIWKVCEKFVMQSFTICSILQSLYSAVLECLIILIFYDTIVKSKQTRSKHFTYLNNNFDTNFRAKKDRKHSITSLNGFQFVFQLIYSGYFLTRRFWPMFLMMNFLKNSLLAKAYFVVKIYCTIFVYAS